MREQLRTRVALWYVLILGIVLAFYVVLVFFFQYASIKRQIYHDEIQDVETVEGLFSFGADGHLHLQQDYFSHPRSRLLIDRLMEVRDRSGAVLYRSEGLNGTSLGGPIKPGEGEDSFNERADYLPDGTHVLLISHTHPVQGRMLLIRLGYSLAPFYARMREFLALLLFAIPGTLLLAGSIGYLIANRALRPLSEMAARAETISANNLDQRLEVGNPQDELGHMARAFNLVLGRLQQSFVQLQRFTADAAHELRTPLASIRSVGELTLRDDDSTSESYKEAIGSILEEAAVLNQTIEDLLVLARTEATHSSAGGSPFSLTDVISEVLTVLEVLLEEHELSIKELRGADTIAVVQADRGLTRTALMNVIHNAVKFSPRRGTIHITQTISDATPEFVTLLIEDEGPGIKSDERDRVFDRFFTGTAEGTSTKTGSGIGLSIAKLAIERSGGTICFDPAATAGARCVVRLPLAT